MGCGLGWFVGPNFSLCDGLSWVGSVVWWVGLGWRNWTHGQLWTQQPSQLGDIVRIMRCFLRSGSYWTVASKRQAHRLQTLETSLLWSTLNGIDLTFTAQQVPIGHETHTHVHLHCESKKQDTIRLPITSPNANRFSKFFYWQIYW